AAKFDACEVGLNGDEAVVTKTETTIFVYEVNSKGAFIKTKEGGKYLARNDKTDYGVELLDKVKTSVCKTNLTFGSNTNGRVDIEICNKYYFYCRVVSSTSIIWKAYTSHVESEDCYVTIYKKKETTPVSVVLNGKTSDSKNKDALDGLDGKVVDNITVERSFAADGGWYTLCLPFALTADDIANTFKGAYFNEFVGVYVDDNGFARLQFKKVTETVAGVPYMVLPKQTVDNPAFTNKTITTTAQTVKHYCTVGAGNTQLEYSFIGVFDPTPVSGTNVRFIGGDKGTELLMPDGPGTINGLRAYFEFPGNASGSVTYTKLNVDDGSTSGIGKVQRDLMPDAIYTISGRKVNGTEKSLAPGVYIINGKKIVK
ncbi:MAG: hypothetical protein MR900_06760, partial [Prevotella sp.]|nr:hypothetical protein [Prevotella sp.]